MRRIKAVLQSGTRPGVCRVVAHDLAAAEWTPDLRLLVLVNSPEQRKAIERLHSALGNMAWIESEQLQAGDVVMCRGESGEVIVLLRESDTHHALFMTNRCNSRCLMCSQPPTTADDDWLVAEAIDAIRHVRRAPRVLGLTGGEPLLLRGRLREVLNAIGRWLPDTQVEILTNGRLLAEFDLAAHLLRGLGTRVRWLVPLYGHADFVHDFVVQARGAFDESIAGLLALQAAQQPIQLRIVLIEPVLQVLPELVGFIGRNLPFVREVALMGCEPIGFALAHREQCEVDLSTWGSTLEQAARVLRRHQVPCLFMNAPLCALPRMLRPFAHRSISDWKNVYADECGQCTVRDDCTGLFAWHERGWKPSPLKPERAMVASA